MKIFNTIHETSLRVLLLLSSYDKTITADEIIVCDFLTIFGKEYGISSYNLHGEKLLVKSEFTLKRELINKSLKNLILEGLVDISFKDRYYYSITKLGDDFCEKLTTDYSRAYLELLENTKQYIKGKNISKLMSKISYSSILEGA